MDLVLGSRFAVYFFGAGAVPNPVDIRFQRVSGLSATVETSSVVEGGQNLYTHRLPKRVSYGNLVLERGVVVGSPLSLEVEVTMSQFQFVPSSVMVTLLEDDRTPRAAWMFLRAYPVRWATADLNANDDKVLIDTLELAYASMQPVRI
jgi:phage tail-like protein